MERKLYFFNDLSKRSKENAISNYRNLKGCFSEKQETIVEHLKTWNYQFYKNGEIY